MAISVDAVYQKVLALANKEQRGYITPQEFNLFAKQAQIEIFEQYFYDVDVFERRIADDKAKLVKKKIELFKVHGNDLMRDSGTDFPPNFYLIENVWGLHDTGLGLKDNWMERIPAQHLDSDKNNNSLWSLSSKLLQPTPSKPVYWITGNELHVYPYKVIQPAPLGGQAKTIFTYKYDYIKTPRTPKWGYVVVTEKALYNSNTSIDFELHKSEESELVYKILALAGIALEKPQLTTIGSGIEVNKQQQEKQ